MKYIFLLMFITGCSWTATDKCHFAQGVAMATGRPAHACMDDPLRYCQEKCARHLNTIIRIGNTTNLYSCECDDK